MAFEANLSRWRTALLALGALLFVLIGLWIVGLIGTPPAVTGLVYAVGWFCIVFFGACAIGWGRKLFQPGVELRIDGFGIRYRRWSGQTIPWSAIARVEGMQVRNQKMLCLFLTDPRAFPSVTILGRLARANKSLGFGDIALSVVGTDQSFDAMVAAFNHFAPARLR